MKKVAIHDTVFQVVKTYPEVKHILFELGFDQIVKPGMLESVGRFVSIERGAKLKKIPIENIKKALYEKGYLLEDYDE